jgi:uncharacterized protein (DUF1684 family)
VLPAAAPTHAGVVRLERGAATLQAAPGVQMTSGGMPVSVMELRSDKSGAPDFVELGDLTLALLQRGARYAIRLWDKNCPARQAFAGLRWYAVDPAYCLTARFAPYDPPKPMTIVDVLGDVSEIASPGSVVFVWQGQEQCLDAQARGQRLFYNFADASNGDTTYSAGRFLYSPLPQAGQVTLDFNLATNPYCAYTPYATCPLPPPQNRLPFRVEAGEMVYALAGSARPWP